MSRFMYSNTSTRVGTGFYLSFLDFYNQAKTYDYIPIYGEFKVEELDSSLLYEKLNLTSPSCILESLIGDENGRYSIIAFHSLKEITNSISTTAQEQIRSFLKNSKIKKLDFDHFTGGFIGVWDYDYTSYKYTNQVINNYIYGQKFFLPGKIIVYDRIEQKLRIMFWFKGQEINTEQYENAIKEINEIYNLAYSECCFKKKYSINVRYNDNEIVDKFQSNVSKSKFMNFVNRAKKHINQGDVFQVVLSRRFSKKSHALPWSVYRIMRQINPSPYMFYINFSDYTLIGASPETQVKVENNKVINKPIAGTRKITGNEDQDKIIKEELLNDEKERAEHLMLVDLSRNDIGRISKTGTVEIKKFMVLEPYSHVVHIVSTVEGEIKQGLDNLDAFKSCFPAGTLTGAPKIKAIELIKDIEKDSRGLYGGSVGYIDFNGNLDSCITIRAILYKKGTYYFQTGAGIVADSVPEAEFEETLHKARVLMISILMAEEIK
ncbi:Anthranilate synthase, aminase component [Candidatus Syntrophocurvum alkaliphilum]|uniref:Anthranilate synthase component 1 n=1 Tax=Candidatus Syntrophocurvum alkaliphilum TaxID=2293317 RepID=A0A6I6DKL7_9FIRM|nr:anthranilate synthase component I family protein [Candidatus Syntrophocurvum alkaliphilum]QGU00095.1 Anthranilate synthase, aminase component [Candidatus Syntrophocurvum alkaliphilum]